MSSLPQRQAGPPRPKPPVRHGRPLTDEQRDILRDVWAYLVGAAGDGVGVTSAFKIHSFALRLLFPRAGKWSSTKPQAYQRYAHEPKLRPFTDAEKQLVFVILSGMTWDDTVNMWTLKRTIAEFAAQIGCGRTRINDALAAQRVSPFPVLQVDSTPAFERDGHKHRGALRFTFIRDPLAFAVARDKVRAGRLTAEEERRKAMHFEIVKLQIARDRGEITLREFSRRKSIITHQIKWSDGEVSAPLVAVEPLAGAEPAPAPQAVSMPLRGKDRRAAFEAITSIYPKNASDEQDHRHRARERFEMLAPTVELVEVITADIRARVSASRSSSTPSPWPDLLTYIREEYWRTDPCV